MSLSVVPESSFIAPRLCLSVGAGHSGPPQSFLLHSRVNSLCSEARSEMSFHNSFIPPILGSTMYQNSHHSVVSYFVLHAIILSKPCLRKIHVSKHLRYARNNQPSSSLIHDDSLHRRYTLTFPSQAQAPLLSSKNKWVYECFMQKQFRQPGIPNHRIQSQKCRSRMRRSHINLQAAPIPESAHR